jgi:hypothetical protein
VINWRWRRSTNRGGDSAAALLEHKLIESVTVTDEREREKITKNHHITGNGFKKPPLFGKFSKNHQSTGNT